ncbi:MAG: hypothetical protein ABIB43_06050 [archaeon]
MFENIQDARVKQLAETLRKNGLAASDTEAVRMATEMTETAGKVQRSYDEQGSKPETNSTNVERAKKEVVEEEIKVESPVKPEHAEETPSEVPIESEHTEETPSEVLIESEQPAPQVPDPSKVNVEEVYKQQEAVIKSSFDQGLDADKTVNELMAEDADRVYGSAADPVDELVISDSEEPVIESEPEQPAKPEVESEVEITPESKPEPEVVDDGYEVDETREIRSEKKSEEERRKSAESMIESQVDLSETFNFNKRR